MNMPLYIEYFTHFNSKWLHLYEFNFYRIINMSLFNCPSCKKKISDKVQECPHCQFSFVQGQEDSERLKVLNYRNYRDKIYRLRMLTFFSMALATAGLVPMLWSYIKALGYGFNVKLTNHWGIYLVLLGFAFYVLIRILMFYTKRHYNSTK